MPVNDMSGEVALELGPVGTVRTSKLRLLAALVLQVLVQRWRVLVDLPAILADKWR